MCLALMIGSVTLAATLQRTLSDHERASWARHRSLQAQAVAEGLLSRTLALLDETSPIDEHCHVMATPPAPAPRFSEWMMQAGARITCRVALQGVAGPGAWQCRCLRAQEDTPTGVRPDGVALTTHAQADLRIETGPSGHLRAIVQAQVLETPDLAARGMHPEADLETAPVWRFSVLLRADPRGVWREKAGSWNDLP